MSTEAPTVEISVNGTTIERTVCGIEMRTRTKDNNILKLTGGIDIRVSDEMANAVVSDYNS